MPKEEKPRKHPDTPHPYKRPHTTVVRIPPQMENISEGEEGSGESDPENAVFATTPNEPFMPDGENSTRSDSTTRTINEEDRDEYCGAPPTSPANSDLSVDRGSSNMSTSPSSSSDTTIEENVSPPHNSSTEEDTNTLVLSIEFRIHVAGNHGDSSNS